MQSTVARKLNHVDGLYNNCCRTEKTDKANLVVSEVGVHEDPDDEPAKGDQESYEMTQSPDFESATSKQQPPTTEAQSSQYDDLS